MRKDVEGIVTQKMGNDWLPYLLMNWQPKGRNRRGYPQKSYNLGKGIERYGLREMDYFILWEAIFDELMHKWVLKNKNLVFFLLKNTCMPLIALLHAKYSDTLVIHFVTIFNMFHHINM